VVKYNEYAMTTDVKSSMYMVKITYASIITQETNYTCWWQWICL